MHTPAVHVRPRNMVVQFLLGISLSTIYLLWASFRIRDRDTCWIVPPARYSRPFARGLIGSRAVDPDIVDLPLIRLPSS